MGHVTVLALRVVIAVALAGSLLVQFALIPLVWVDLAESSGGMRPSVVAIAVLAIVVLGIAAMQVIAVCIWRLLTMVRRGTVFSHAAFRYVDIVIGAIMTTSLLTFVIAVLAAYTNRTTPGDEVAPGVVGLICGASLVLGGVALIVVVLRILLVQAVALDSEARDLKSELDEVI